MTNAHLIDTAAFDINFSSEELAFALQSELESLIKNALMPVVSEVFDASSAVGKLVRIPLLELDIGTVTETNYREELPRRLKEKLIDWFGEIDLADVDTPTNNGQVLDPGKSRYDLITYFLVYGYFPWHAQLGPDETIEQWLVEWLVDEPQMFIQFLRSTQHQKIVLDRLMAQFSSHTIFSIVRLLSPSYAESIKQRITQWLAFNAHGERASGHRNRAESKQALWSAVMQVLLDRGQQALDDERVFDQALLKLKHVTNSKALVLNTESKLFGINNIKAEHQARFLQLQKQWAVAMVTGVFSDVKNVWNELLKDYPTLMEKGLRHYGQQAETRKRIAHGFPEPALQKILMQLEPREHGFISSLIEHPELFQHHLTSPPQPKVSVIKQLWEYTLAYLLVEGGSRFNKKMYLESVIRQMAAANILVHADLLTGLRQQLSVLAETSSSAKQMCQLLMELTQETGTHSTDDAIQDANVVTMHQQQYTLYDELITVLSQGGMQTKGKLQRTMDALARTAPWMLIRLLRELQFNDLAPSVSIEKLSASQLQPLVMIFLRLSQAKTASVDFDLIKAIETYANQSLNRTYYFRKILLCLLQDELIDFDVIMAETSTDSDVQVTPPLEKKSVMGKSTAPLNTSRSVMADDETVIVDYLNSEVSVSQREAMPLIGAYTRLLNRHPQYLRQYLPEIIADKRRLTRLLLLLPERLLSHTLSHMGMSEPGRLFVCAELIASACHLNALKINAKRISERKWQAIFGYLTTHGRTFNEARFVSYLLTEFYRQSGEENKAHFNALISQQLEANTLPSTAELTKRIVQGIVQTELSPSVESSPPSTVAEQHEAYSDAFQDPELLAGESIYIANAGMVLASPYLQRLFSMQSLTEGSAFKNHQAATRGVHMLEFMVNESSKSPEYQLVLNKLLCGVKAGETIERDIVINEQEKQQVEGLIQGMIQNWKALGSTSIAGFRESFLQREGHLQLKDDAWHLLVEARAFDMLLDQIPWSYSTIKYPWMERVIYVEWR